MAHGCSWLCVITELCVWIIIKKRDTPQQVGYMTSKCL